MTRFSRSRTSATVAVTAFLAAAPLVGATTASATTASDCRTATVQYRIVDADGNPVGADWTSQGGFHQWDSAPGTVEVRLAPGQDVGAGCTYPVSLAEYTTEGSNWYTSGHQTLVDHATVYLTADDVASGDDAKRTWQKLAVKSPDCYGQIDLYGDDVVYDGGTGEGHGPAPYQPGNVVTPYHLIAAWNGGDKPCTPDQPESPTPSASTPASQPPAPETSAPATPTPSTPASSTPPPTSSTPPTTSHVPPMKTPPPTTPAPSPSTSTPPLAETGASSSTPLIAGGAALVIALGAGTLFATRRARKSS
ncbi:LAETG motif-containing sortase-dependent surface protein [Streptomyces sp. NPDC051987]|uniref:LAETG motif-containing sortase-dependent surface protein n=1 Tax=Streptomyces sp. NPDC051987 TaxID=3155808 RepID=UPI003431C06E